MPQVGFEHTIPVIERTKTVQVHALDRAATVFGQLSLYYLLNKARAVQIPKLLIDRNEAYLLYQLAGIYSLQTVERDSTYIGTLTPCGVTTCF
jgi:hypothetical protein